MSEYDAQKDAHDSYFLAVETERLRLAASLVALAQANVPTDIQALLVDGDPMRGIKPNALYHAIVAARRWAPEPVQEGLPW